MSLSDFIVQMEGAIRDPGALELLYRRAVAQGQEEAFRRALEQELRKHGPTDLLKAWGYRLQVLPLEELATVREEHPADASRSWILAILISVTLGLAWVFLAREKPPVPIPNEGSPTFWLGWAPTTALAILAYLSIEEKKRERLRWNAIAAVLLLGLTFLVSWTVWGRKDSVAFLTSLHVTLFAWMALGLGITAGLSPAMTQRMGYFVKSVEVLVAAGVYLAGAGLFGVLTLGIFQVLGVRFSPEWIQRGAAFAMGVTPVLVIASLYDPGSSPAEQDFSLGLTRLLRLLARLLLAPSLGVLLVYVLWFIPRYFWKPFEERGVLIIYNASIAALLLLLVIALPQGRENLPGRWEGLLRHSMRVISFLAAALNLYALAAVVGRTLRYGLTPNRHAVIGWNVITFLVLASMLIEQFRCSSQTWTTPYRRPVARVLPLALIWTVWVLLVSPFLG